MMGIKARAFGPLCNRSLEERVGPASDKVSAYHALCVRYPRRWMLLPTRAC
jgi:hypothetical protein